MSQPSYRWLQLALGAPKNDRDPALLLINGRPATADEFRRALLKVEIAVDALDQAGGLQPEEVP